VGEVFLYTGVGEGAIEIPTDVVRIRIDPSVLVIAEWAFALKFKLRYKLREVQLHDGLREICDYAFQNCRALNVVHISDGVERIGDHVFSCCILTKFRSPPLVTTIPYALFHHCNRMLSLEVPENVVRVKGFAFDHCYSLRNVALATNTIVEDAESTFQFCDELLQIFNTRKAIVIALQTRFNGLPIHSKMYYKSYYDQMTAEEFLNTIIIGENGELDPTGFQQDCLGMTPLHILACSTVHSLELYRVMINNYPENLIVADAWGALPLLYAVLGNAPSEIIHFLVNRYQSLYPDHGFDWRDMLITLARVSASEGVIQNLLDVKQILSSEYNINWERVFWALRSATFYRPYAYPETFCFLTRCSIATRINAIGVKHFRDAMAYDWTGSALSFNRQAWRDAILAKLDYYESEYGRLKETTSILELAIWKMKINDGSKDLCEKMGGGSKKIKRDGPEFRLQCRISCGANIVIKNVWPYLLPSKCVHSRRHQ
jgi:hypothetical protein